MKKLLHDLDLMTGSARCGEMPKSGKRLWIARILEHVNCPKCLKEIDRPLSKLEVLHFLR